MTGERRIEPFPLVDMVGARGVKVDFLQEIDIRRLLLHARGDLVEIGFQTFLAPGP